ncbi:endocuticle structural glycoprotein SgAbd-1 [Sitodiplosis mosellana]|uniref:endocuticle structural glycoprotein SgAbd-1 n=1 Tax=Sitodiplosis mosellana TaxID=263140 RepID=UPI002444894D|nr:endocuticle structural glycoprotein SgAbd-1 [Sitodiplosis mosellana]
MVLQAVKILLIGFFGLALVRAQDDGRYRPSGDDGRYRGDNDGRYTGTNGEYLHQGGGGSGGGNLIVSIGNRPAPKATTTKSPPPPPPPTPPVYVIDPQGSGVVVNQVQEPATLGAAAADIQILRQEHEETENGYRYVYETQNGILAEETAQIEKTEEGKDAYRKVGYYQYLGDDDILYRVDYVADSNGFQPTGDHLPTPPPIPPEIQELLNNLATKQPDAAQRRGF